MKTKLLAVAALAAGWTAFAADADSKNLDLWVRVQKPLATDAQFADVSNFVVRAAKAGYTGIVFSHIAFDTPWAVSEAERNRLVALRRVMDAHGLEMVPIAWSVGYGTMCNVHDDLIETVAVTNAPYVARGGEIVADLGAFDFPNGDLGDFDLAKNKFANWYADMPGVQAFVDTNVFHSAPAALRVQPGREKGGHARFLRHIAIRPGRRYRFTAHFRAKDLVPKYEAINMLVLSDAGRTLASKEVNRLEEPEGWRRVSIEFEAGESRGAHVYCGSWRAKRGTFWVDDVSVVETGPTALSVRKGDPLVLRSAKTGRVYEPGRDFTRIRQSSRESIRFVRPAGSAIADGEKLLLDAFTWSRSGPKQQMSTCMSDPKLYDCFRRAAKWVHANIRPKHWFLSLDEVRNGGTCPLCLARRTDMAHILGTCVRRQRDILRETDPDVEICAWSDMFDPNHNAKETCCGCRGTFVGIWDVIPKDVQMMLWWGKMLPKSVPFFAARGFTLRGSVCMDSHNLDAIAHWKRWLGGRPDFRGYVYTTWCDDYTLLEAFAREVKAPSASDGALRAEKLPPLPDGAFTYAVIPDTQAYDGEGRHTKRGRAPGVGPTRNEKLDRTVGWLAANARTENIRFVSHTGDITDMNNDFQWRFASNAMARLDGAVPYAVVPGNHDMKSSGDTSLFSRHFPAARFAKNAWYAETFPGFTNSAGLFVSGDNANSCCLFEGGREKFVVLHLECNAPDPVLAWGGRMLEKYADRHAIVATHQDLGAIERKNARRISDAWGKLSAGERKTWSPDLALLGRLNWCKCHGKDGNSGADIWKKLSSRHRNVFLVVSGDQGMVKVTRVDEKGACGNTVHSLMQDTGGGYIRLFRFVPAEKAVRCYTVNPSNGELVTEHAWWHDAKWFNFTLPYPGAAAEAGAPSAAPEPAAKASAAIPADDPIAARKVTWKGVPNARDLGGLPGRDGKTVRRGRIYRSAGLNDNAHYRVPGSKKQVLPKDQWKGPGRTRVKPDTIRYITETLGVRTDLDLRTDGEVFGMTGSPLGEKVKWVRISSSNYGGMDSAAGRAAFVRDFRLFLDETNYPVVFHCIAGADRTGSLACILNGLLGVDADLLHRDWQYTWTGRDKPEAAPEKRWNALMKVFDKYTCETLNARIEAYVLSCGITADEIARFRALMLEP